MNDLEDIYISEHDPYGHELHEQTYGRNIIMTRKDFQAIADVLNTCEDKETKSSLALSFCTIFAQKNARFKKDLFLKACGVV